MSGRKGLGWTFHGQDGGFLRVEVLPFGPAKCCKSILKCLHTTQCAHLEEGHAVIGKLGGANSLTSKLQTHLRNGLKPAMQSPSYKQVHGRGKRAPLPNPYLPGGGAGGVPLDLI